MNMLHLAETGAVATRRRAMVDYVMNRGNVEIDELVTRFATSRMTIHRDLQALSAQGLLRRVHGGVTALPNGIAESSMLYRRRRAMREKKAMAAMAASMIVPGDVIALDDSTTACCMVDHLATMGGVTVVTNSLGIASTLAGMPSISLMALGGRYHPIFDAFFGLMCEQAIGALRVNTLFMSVSAVHGVNAYHQEQEIVKAKHALMRSADRRVLMADSTKFGSNALNRLADLSEFDVVITDDGLDPAIRDSLLDHGVTLQMACLCASNAVTPE
ncbi:DeoR family transcriptional regulator [Komagataeibacter nataicola]|uniref:DeoR family transcriptional regulator n=1 Tax=Komagataeibacter nataicola TaxID=265960 RepID=A0A9N7H349_9PROT|nr:DeoR/GlpR family DNA-binding transcription regulator [Komagataeibacter nataicola]AQU88695.1 DeoR family transcriptional regulator [Komagataeibacter nataicola]PYD66694.1 DeoR family transcriptional regulator [Komagataeibacter nataicola]WEQ57056.1 DeoR/GlpR family DNA-binding transcription regulator [Komagataeibacter nataicola]GBR26189.1 transcriptional regulator [Komagataeibacter nataicola NRIC 0616]